MRKIQVVDRKQIERECKFMWPVLAGPVGTPEVLLKFPRYFQVYATRKFCSYFRLRLLRLSK